MGITSFICDSFHSIGTWLFSSLDENYKLKILLAKLKKSFDIFASSILQPKDSLFSYCKI